jgi:Trk K+ transport system NAD-binding subunit
LGEFRVDVGWVGHRYVDLGFHAGVTVAVVNRFGEGLRVHPDLVVQEDDHVRVLYEVPRAEEVAEILSTPPEDHA